MASHRGFVEQAAVAASSSEPCASLFNDGANIAVQDDESAPPASAAPTTCKEMDTTRTKKALPSEDPNQASFISEVTQTQLFESPSPAQEAEVPPPTEVPTEVPTTVPTTVKPS